MGVVESEGERKADEAEGIELLLLRLDDLHGGDPNEEEFKEEEEEEEEAEEAEEEATEERGGDFSECGK